MRNHKAVDPDLRRSRVLESALALAQRDGYRKIRREDVAEQSGIAVGSVNLAFGTMQQLRDAVMTEAINRGLVGIVAEGIGNSDALAKAAPLSLRKKAIEFLAK